MKTAQSVKDRLKAVAKKQGKVVQDVFTMYVLERVLYRLSISEYKDNFALKGGILLYGMFDEFDRITTDIDLLGNRIRNDAENIEFVFEDGRISDRTYYYAENMRHNLDVEYGENGLKFSFNGMEREVSF